MKQNRQVKYMETKFQLGELVFVDYPHEFWKGLGVITMLPLISERLTYCVKTKNGIGGFEESVLKKVSPADILKYKLTGEI
jgi:hypothetical protein